ncbi:MAG: TSUP family transporter [Oscillospiraceae bacterium]
MTISLGTRIFLFAAIFLAGGVDSIAGGGGLISLPAYVFAGLPMHLAYGTNKFGNMFGTVFASLHFAKKKKILWKATVFAVPASLIGSWLGAKITLLLTEHVLSLCLLIILPVASVFMLFGTKKIEKGDRKMLEGGKLLTASVVVGFFCGAYDGFFGPGTGTFLVLGFTSLVGMDFVMSSGTAKILNLASNIGALFVFLRSGDVFISLGLQCALCSILGNLIGAKLATDKGAKVIKPIIVLVIAAVMIKLVLQFF